MSKIARIFAFALGLAGLSGPALAAVCSPTPALPDTERRTEYAGIVAQTGPFNVNFQLYGDGVDYGNWVSVWVNGVALTPVTDFVVTSPTGPLANLCRPISDAQVTFTAVQTGTIEIEGSRRPRRTSQSSENAGITARTFNQVVSDMTAQLRERWDRQPRLLRTAPGDSVTPMPSAAVRAGKFLYFDNTGLNPQFTTGGAGSGNVVGPPSSTVGHFATWNNATGTLLADSATVPASAFANPTASIGLTAVNGSAVTIMRSSDAPPLSQAIVPTWTGVHTFSASPNFVLIGTGNVNVSNLAQNTIQFQGAGNSLTTAIHLNPGTGTIQTSTISEVVGERTAIQAFGGNYGRWSNSNLGSGLANQSGIIGEFGGTTPIGPYLLQIGIENPPSTFTAYEGYRFQTVDGGSETTNVGAMLFGATATVPRNQIAMPIQSIGSPGTRDSHRIVWEGKANNGTERAVWWRQFANVTSNAGASTFKLQSNLNGAGWTDRFAVTDAGALSVATIDGAVIGGVAPAAGTFTTLNSKAGNSATNVGAGGSLTAQVVSAGTPASTTKTTLQTFTLPANTLDANGRGIRVRAWGTFAANGNTKTVTLDVGGSTLYTSTGLTSSGSNWVVMFEMFRTGSNAQTYWGTGIFQNTIPTSGASTSAFTDSGTIVVALTGQNGSASANDIVCLGMAIDMIN